MNNRKLFSALLSLLFLLSHISLDAKGGYGFVVILDAGHGGKDPGAIGHGGKEKDITLAVVKKLGEIIKSDHPEVKVLYTRQTDVFVGLQARADFANRNNGSLFISVHVNSTGKNTGPRGTETYVIGLNKQKNNLSVAMRENEVILLEDNYQQTYRGFNPREAEHYIMFDLMQEAYINQSIGFASEVQRNYKRSGMPSRGVRQDGLWVLSQSAMPAVLTEIGFISNPSEAQYILSSEGQTAIARSIARAFTAYYTAQKGTSRKSKVKSADSVDTSQQIMAESLSVSEQEPTSIVAVEQTKTSERRETKAQSSVSTKTYYRVQFSTSSEKLSPKDKIFDRLKQKVFREQVGKRYAYLVGQVNTLKEAKAFRKEVCKLYKDAIIVEYQDGIRQKTIY